MLELIVYVVVSPPVHLPHATHVTGLTRTINWQNYFANAPNGHSNLKMERTRFHYKNELYRRKRNQFVIPVSRIFFTIA